MTDINWPETLPPVLRLEWLSDTLPQSVIRTQMETGPHKQRRRFTAAVEPLTGTLLLSADQTVIFDAFYRDALQMGALSFNWIHPRTLQSVEMRIIGNNPPKYSPAGGQYVLSLNLEVLP